jgi:hypothetical protein
VEGLASKSSDPSDPSAATNTATGATSDASSVDRVTNQRKTEVLQVHSNLMRTASLQLTKHQRNWLSVAKTPALYGFKMSHGITALRGINDRHPNRRLRIPPDWCVNRSRIWRFAIDEGQITPRHRPIRQLGHETDNRQFRAGDYQQPTSIFVQTMDNPGAGQARLIWPMMQNTIH